MTASTSCHLRNKLRGKSDYDARGAGQRWLAIVEELNGLTEGRAKPDVPLPDGREADLLQEQDRIEWELGELDREQLARGI